MDDIFYYKPEEYHNRLDPLNDWVEQMGMVISKVQRISLEEGIEKARVLMQKNVKNPTAKIFFREENGDRSLQHVGLLNYIKSAVNDKSIIAPTFTTYLNSEQKPSMHAKFMEGNIVGRAKDKKAAQKAKAEGRTQDAVSLNNLQNNKKTKNNIVSGLLAMSSSILHNVTGHSSLTSMTRSITSLSNANNERLIGGNRALYTRDDVLRSIVNEATYTNQELVQLAIEHYGLHIPTVQDVVHVLQRSSDLYFLDNYFYQNKVVPLLETFTPYQLAGIAYSIDLYHLRKFNDEFMRKFFTQLTKKVRSEEVIEDHTVMYKLDNVMLMYIHTIFFEEIKGLGVDYEKMNIKGILPSILATYKHLERTLNHYKLFFNAFVRVNIAPINSFRLEYMRRRVVVLSDTDSSAFTADDFIQWKLGQFIVNDESIALSGCVTYLASESIVHQLQRLSNTMNIEKKNLRRLAMKNEYLWITHIPANVSKHYYADAVIQEGSVHIEADLECKGVHLKNSAVPPEIIDMGLDIMNYILHAKRNNIPLSFLDVLRRGIKIEDLIIDSIKRGETNYLKNVNINGPTSYSQPPERSPYSRHLMWKQVFEGTHGEIPEPPYATVKIPLKLANKTDIANWVEGIEDAGFKSRLEAWLERNNKTSLPNLYINSDFILDNGFPKEIQPIVNTHQIVMDLTTQIRTIIETLGVVLNPDLLIKDQYKLDVVYRDS